jgi:hypothetical protein
MQRLAPGSRHAAVTAGEQLVLLRQHGRCDCPARPHDRTTTRATSQQRGHGKHGM